MMGGDGHDLLVLRSGDGLAKKRRLGLQLAVAFISAQEQRRPCVPEGLQALCGGHVECDGE